MEQQIQATLFYQTDKGLSKTLASSLDELIRKYPELKYSHPIGDDQQKQAFIQWIFSRLFHPKIPRNFLIADWQQNPDRESPMISIRLSPELGRGPLHSEIQRHSLALIARLEFKDREKSWKTADGLSLKVLKLDLFPTDALPFEKQIQCTAEPVFSDGVFNKAVYSPKNKLKEWIGDLDAINIKTAKELKKWRDFVNWKSRILSKKMNAVTVKFVRTAIDHQSKAYAIFKIDPQHVNQEHLKEHFKKEDLVLMNDEVKNIVEARDGSQKQNPRSKTRTLKLGRLLNHQQLQLQNDEIAVGLHRDDQKVLERELKKIYSEGNSSGPNIAESETLENLLTEIFPPKKFSGLNWIGQSAMGDVYLQKRLGSELEALQNGVTQNYHLLNWLFDPTKVQEVVPGPVISEWHNTKLSDDQKQCVQTMMDTKDVCFVQGPPGTGKTTIIAETIAQCVKKGLRVLVASQANIAVENALERIAHHPSAKILRLGNGERIADSPFAPKNALKQNLIAKKNFLQERIRVWDQQNLESQELKIWIQNWDICQQNLGESQKHVADLQHQLQVQKHQVSKYQGLDQIREELVNLQNWLQNPLLPLPKLSEEGRSKSSPFFKNLLNTEIGRIARQTNQTSMGLFIQKIALWQNQSQTATPTNSEFIAKLSQLEARKKQLHAQLSEDEACFPEFQLVNQEIKDLRSQMPKSELDPELSDDLRRMGFNPFDPPIQHWAEWNQALALAVQGFEQELKQRQADFDLQMSEKFKFDLEIKSLETKLGQAQNQLQNFHNLMQSHESKLLIPESYPEDRISYARSRYQELEETIKNDLNRSVLRKLYREWNNDIDNCHTKPKDNEEWIKTCNVVGVTCTEKKQTLTDLGYTQFDLVIIDEVSKATPPELIMPLSMGSKCVLVGDHRQLPPLFREGLEYQDFEESEILQHYSEFVTASLFKRHFEQAHPSAKAMLMTQYRMHDHIMDLVNGFYEYQLQSGLSAEVQKKDRNHNLSLLDNNGREWLSPNGHAYWLNCHAHKQENQSLNLKEASLTVKLVKKIYEQCQQQGLKIGIVTFYREQSRAIQNELRTANLRIPTDTVEMFQGKEFDVVIVSLVRNQSSGIRSNVAQFERINVALSRAKSLLFIIGDQQVFARQKVNMAAMEPNQPSRKVPIYEQMIRKLQSNQRYIESDDVFHHEKPYAKNTHSNR